MENQLQIVECDISLKKGELCHLIVPAQNMKLKTVIKRFDYAGFSTRIKLWKGFSFRAGTFKPGGQKEYKLEAVDVGTIYVTNQRLFFLGSQSSKSIALAKIVGFEFYTDGFKVKLEKGNFPIFKLDNGHISILMETLNYLRS